MLFCRCICITIFFPHYVSVSYMMRTGAKPIGNEPISLVVVKEQSFSVTGMESYQQILNAVWIKYNTFQHFMDFYFRRLSVQKQVISKLTAREDIWLITEIKAPASLLRALCSLIFPDYLQPKKYSGKSEAQR